MDSTISIGYLLLVDLLFGWGTSSFIIRCWSFNILFISFFLGFTILLMFPTLEVVFIFGGILCSLFYAGVEVDHFFLLRSSSCVIDLCFLPFFWYLCSNTVECT